MLHAFLCRIHEAGTKSLTKRNANDSLETTPNEGQSQLFMGPLRYPDTYSTLDTLAGFVNDDRMTNVSFEWLPVI